MGGNFRVEKDSMGEMQVPNDAYYGAQTQRACENFPISGIRIPRSMIAALGLIKQSAAEINLEIGLLDKDITGAIVKATQEVCEGKLDAHFVVDIFQTGSGTSSNMNANEVIARRAKEILENAKNVHPNDHVNMGQSSNDVFPTSIHIAVALELTNKLIPALKVLESSLAKKQTEYAKIVKTGRTHLQDATPITLGQEFGGYKRQVEQSIERIKRSLVAILELPLGGTAVGTGLNTPEGFPAKVIARIAKNTGLKFFEAVDHFEAQSAKDGLVEMSGQLRTVACSLAKIANDIRWLASGPRCGIGEIQLASVQPGSSIMPGKVNPVIAESLLMVCAQVIGNDATVHVGGSTGSIFELNMMMPVMGNAILQSIELLSTSAVNFANKCVDGIEANVERLNDLAEASIAICTALAPKIGYDLAADLAKEAFKTGKPLRQVAKERKVLPDAELDKVLDLDSMTRPGL
jgi:fumarate hydratase class II